MARSDRIDDAAIEALLAGNGAGGELASLAAFVGELRAMASGPAPIPSAQLAAMLAEGFSPGGGGVPAAAASDGGRRPRPADRRRVPSWAPTRALSGLSLGLRAAFSGGVALVAVTAAGAAGALPGPAQRIVSTAIEAVTPFDLPGDDAGRGDAGRRAGADGTDDGGGGPAVTGEVAPGAHDGGGAGGEGGGRPEAPGQAGLDRAGETPAAGHAPPSVPGGGAGAGGAPAAGGPPTAPPGTGQDVAGGTPAAPRLPTTLPAGPPVTTPAQDVVPTLPTLPATVPTTLPTTDPTIGGRPG